MTSPNFLKAAYQAGFKDNNNGNIVDNGGSYALLHPTTDGRSGRKVFIDLSLAPKFGELKEDELFKVFHELTKLKAVAGNINSYTSQRHAGSHISVFGITHVTYEIIQQEVNGNPGGVYITDIDIGRFGDDNPGVYHVRLENRHDWVVTNRKKPIRKVKTKVAAINGFCDGITQAAQEVMPPILGKAFSYSDFDNGVNIRQEKEYSLFFNPPVMYSKGEPYNCNSVNSHVAMNSLRETLVNSDEKILWGVLGDGAHLLYEALRFMPEGKRLGNHTVLFLNPSKDLTEILPLMRRHNMKLHMDVQKIQENDQIAIKAQFDNQKKLQNELRKWPGFEKKAAALYQQNLSMRNKVMSTFTGAFGWASGAASAVSAGMYIALYTSRCGYGWNGSGFFWL
ncbi:hypothetical protein [Marinibactrum halimedae]|uniref:Uncharacterized protein n=1 Tax=Marinibactrum halimedae TaxID=1444977 RepID=A0AA37TAN3_9GAMM|nr:hypothetical protein [Marinibactrum halimedae]MCD9458573.1 hypothetical protein [Marinibactrum halimedae]GLS26560.1 hypothetical protein GCM10007877_22760 [Marinibactrum halimedae]